VKIESITLIRYLLYKIFFLLKLQFRNGPLSVVIKRRKTNGLKFTQTSIRTAVLISPDESRWYNIEDQSLVETGGGGCILGWLGECGAVTADFSSCNYICCMWKQPTLIPDFFPLLKKKKNISTYSC
jgi:hypothetical protein